jgi:hypothetical protein
VIGKNETPDPEGGDSNTVDKKAQRKAKVKEGLEAFKESSKKAAQNLARSLQNSVENETQRQVDIRLRLLNNTLDKVRNSVGLGRMREPTNIYKAPYIWQGISNGLGGQVSSTFFFDVQNSLRDFAGDSLGSVLGGKVGGMIKGND